MDKKIIEAKFTKNTNAYTIGLLGLILFIAGSFQIYKDYLRAARFSYYGPRNFAYFFNDALSLFCSYWGSFGGYIVYLGIILLITFLILFFMMRNCALTIQTTRVTGKASFGKQVDLPLNKISAISLSAFKGLTVATSAGRIHFWLIENRDEVYNALNELLSNIQTTSPQNGDSSNSADELKKFKELLDDGIITQEEFDAKKKQILGL